MTSLPTVQPKGMTPIKLSVSKHPSFEDRFYFRSRDLFKIILIADIRYIESKRGYIDLHTTGGIYRGLPLKLKSFSDQMSSKLLLRVHRSYIVNVIHIDTFSKNVVYVNTNEESVKIPLGATYREDVFSFLVSNIQRLMMD